MLTTEGTYPVTRGGVSTWCDTLVRGVPGVRFHLYAILATPHLAALYPLPKEIKLIRVPMWGTEEPSEHLDLRFSTIFERKQRTTEKVIRQEFLPLMDSLLTSILSGDRDGIDIGKLFYQMHLFFFQYDYAAAIKSEPVWNFYLDGLRTQRWMQSSVPTLLEAVQSMGWLYRFLIVLNTPVPHVDVIHSSAAAFCGLPGLLGKLHYKTPYLLTEHGVYLREQYLSIGRSSISPFGKRFLIGLIQATTAANYAYADLVAPVAAFNARWQRRLGVPEERIQVIYNGVDPGTYTARPRKESGPPTVVSVARIDPIKDIVTLLRAAAIVHKEMPEAKFVVYGGISVPSYYRRCLDLRRELGLDDHFIFAGHVSDVPQAYASGDIVVLSSISEGFPYAVIEAMMSGRAVVATDVGGTREACEGVGLLVQPQNPADMATAVLRLLGDSSLRLQMAEDGRQRALSNFTIQRNLDLHRQVYTNLAEKFATASQRTAVSASQRAVATAHAPLARAVEQYRQLALDRAQALVATGQIGLGIKEYRRVLDLDPRHPAAPSLLLQIAEVCLQTGDLDRALLELERAEALAVILDRHSVA